MPATRKPTRKTSKTSKARKTSSTANSGGHDTVYEMVTERIVAMLEAGTVPWHKAWSAASAPRNIEGHAYRGVNVFLLATQPYGSPFWLTFNQAKARGGSVKKGEHGTVITFWKRLVVPDDDQPGKTKVVPMLRFYRVFNLEQTENVKLPAKVADWSPNETDPDFSGLDAAEAIFAGYPNGPTVRYGGDRACYTPMLDVIQLPRRETFDNAEEFFSTAFHEQGHSTGHRDRLNRKTLVEGDGFGGHEYGREELVAEMTAAFLCAEAGITVTQQNSAAYLAGWIRTIKEDVRAVVVAAGAAQRAADHVLGRVYEPTTEAAPSDAPADSPAVAAA